MIAKREQQTALKGSRWKFVLDSMLANGPALICSQLAYVSILGLSLLLDEAINWSWQLGKRKFTHTVAAGSAIRKFTILRSKMLFTAGKLLIFFYMKWLSGLSRNTLYIWAHLILQNKKGERGKSVQFSIPAKFTLRTIKTRVKKGVPKLNETSGKLITV